MYTKQTLNETIGSKIRLRRKALKMTQRNLADFLDVSFQQIQKYENGASSINIQAFLKLCQCLKVLPQYFLESVSFKEDDSDNIIGGTEQELLTIFRAIQNDKVKVKILNLIKVLVSTLDED